MLVLPHISTTVVEFSWVWAGLSLDVEPTLKSMPRTMSGHTTNHAHLSGRGRGFKYTLCKAYIQFYRPHRR